MSYILDALKKAEAEREGAAAQALSPGGGYAPPAAQPQGLSPDGLPRTGGTPPMVWAVVGLSITLAVVALGWMFMGRSDPAPVQMVEADVAATTSSVAPKPAQPPVAPESVREMPPEAPPVDEPVRLRPPSREALQDETPPPVMQFSTLPPRAPATRVEASRQATPAVRSAPAAAATPSEAARVYALNELPANIRQQLPQLSVGGAMYSESPASRMLILNGQPFKEGDRPMTHLKLEQINLKSAVLSYRGYHYSISY